MVDLVLYLGGVASDGGLQRDFLDRIRLYYLFKLFKGFFERLLQWTAGGQ